MAQVRKTRLGVDRRRLALLVLLGLILVLAACSGGTPSANPTQTQSPPTSIPSSPTSKPPEPTATPAPDPVKVALAPDLPERYAEPLRTALDNVAGIPSADGIRPIEISESTDGAGARFVLVPLPVAQSPLAERFYAVVVPFSTVEDDVSLDAVRSAWLGSGDKTLYVTPDAAEDLTAVLGPYGGQPSALVDLLANLEADSGSIGIVAFDQLDPMYKVLTVDGVNVLSNHFDPQEYPLAVGLAAEGDEADLLMDSVSGAIEPVTNRDGERLTTLIMTGVTAMTRVTALKMEQNGYTYPSEVISGTLSAADITHVSNEVPFIKGCVVNATEGNLTMCSDYTYWAALEAIGTDIVGLSGNHVNDFGADGARESLKFYADNGIPIYGSGLNTEEACKPLLYEHNGNTFGFVAALAYDPWYAWASDTEPGACYYYDHKEEVLNSVRELAQKVDVVAVELQYYETYNPFPTEEQVTEFRELRDAGADIVTGVQSHVPQALEPYGNADAGGPGIIVYGLGNLFFDQMWSWETRTELYVRHTIYQGRVLSTEILTGVLEDYAQPRWATADERAGILQSIFDGAPARP